MTSLAQCNNVAEVVGPTRSYSVNFPFPAKNGIAPSIMMTASLHLAFTLAASPLFYILSD